MGDPRPAELLRLLDSTTARDHDAAWEAFVAVHSRLLLHVARSTARGHDAAMDAYAFILERLSADGCRRLRAFDGAGRASFTTWLVVVARRLCIDFDRQRYGRVRDGTARDGDARPARRRLADLSAEEIDVAAIADVSSEGPDAEMDAAAWRHALALALGELEPRDRLLLALRFEDGQSAERIAMTLALPTPFHVYRRLNHVLAQLRERVTKLRAATPLV
jgi:RNA polymerase sigma factor (sigma-70 family)